MIRTGKVKLTLLLALGIMAISLVGSAAQDAKDHCLDNETCMILQQSSMGDCQDNRVMTCCMIDENMTNKSCYIAEMDQNVSLFQSRLNCTDFWLEKAIELHELHMEDPSTATNESQMELMDCMIHAHECMIGKNISTKIMNCTAACNESAESGQMYTYIDQTHLNHANFWLEQAIELHEMHLENPSTATNESQMKMMDYMMHAHECVTEKSAAMGMTDQERKECANTSLKMAMEMHELYMKEHIMDMNESEMEMMEQMKDHMMHAYDCMTGEHMTMGMNNTTRVQFSGDYEHGC